MLRKINEIIDTSDGRYRKLILVTGLPNSGKSALLQELSTDRKSTVVNMGVALGRRLMMFAKAKRPILIAPLVKEIINEASANDIVLIDNIELLFDRTLHANPLDLLKRNSSRVPIVAVWPGGWLDNRLTYASAGHPEYQNDSADGVNLFEIR